MSLFGLDENNPRVAVGMGLFGASVVLVATSMVSSWGWFGVTIPWPLACLIMAVTGGVSGYLVCRLKLLGCVAGAISGVCAVAAVAGLLAAATRLYVVVLLYTILLGTLPGVIVYAVGKEILGHRPGIGAESDADPESESLPDWMGDQTARRRRLLVIVVILAFLGGGVLSAILLLQ